jgi:5'-methylthioadenosine/S-adenosylhomocysteine nucleosidase
LLLTWIGKIYASIWTTLLLERYNIDKIINIWIAWNTLKQKKAKIWDVFLINEVYQHDWYLPFEWEHLDYFKKWIKINLVNIETNFNFNIFNWICATWDQFINSKDKIDEIIKKTNADVVEMEAFAIASVCRQLWKLKNLCIIKAVSDGADSNANEDHEINLDLAMKNSIQVLEKVIKSFEKQN